MALPTGQRLYRSYSQIANPYLDQSKEDQIGAGTLSTQEDQSTMPGAAGMGTASPYATGGGVTGRTYPTPQVTPTPAPTTTSNTATNRALGGTSATTAPAATLTSTQKPTLEALLGKTQTRGGGTPGALSQAAGVGSTAAQGIGGMVLGNAMMHAGTGAAAAGGLGASALLGGATMGAGLLGGLALNDYLRHKANIANDITSNDARELVRAAYRDYLGRDPSEAEVTSHLGNAGGSVSNWINPNQYRNALSNIVNSEEAQKYAANPNWAAADQAQTTPAPTAGAESTGDPIRDAVRAAYTTKGIKPKDQADEDYWVRRIKETGSWDDPQHQAYWKDRMGMKWGGVGDYSESGKVGSDTNYRMEPGYGSSAGGNTFGSSLGGNSPYMQSILQALGVADTPQSNIPFVDFRTIGSMDTNNLLAQIMAQLKTGR